MKTKSLFIAFISLVLALSVISCNNDTAYEGVKNNAEYVKLHIGQMGLNSRQIDKVDFYEEYKDASYVLSGSLKTEDDKFEKEYKGLSELETASIEIKTGTWTFTLLAYNSDDEIKTNGILSDTKEFEITSDSKTLDFSLEFCEEQTLTGNLEYTVTVPYVDSASMTVTLVKDGTVFSPKEPYDVLSGYSKNLFAVDPVSYKKYGQMSTGNGVIEMLPLVQKDDSYQTTFTFDNLPVGTYQLRIVYTTDYMEDDLYRVTTDNEANIEVYPLVTRTGSTIIENINKAYKITYAKSEAYSPDTSNLPNVIDKLGKITLPALERTQYTFDGWYYWLNDEKKTLTSDVDKDGNTIYNLYGSTLSSNIELYTAWTEIPLGNFAVTFNSMGGSPVDNQTIEENSCATKPADPERTGYTFDGWYTSSDFVGNAYDFGTPVKEAIELFAKWTAETYSVTFVGLEDAEYDKPANTYTIETETITLGQASKEGYDFGGWYISSDFKEGTDVTEIAAGSTGDKTFYAKWTIKTFTITYTTLYGTEPDEVTVEWKTILSKEYFPTLEEDGYIFNGWTLDGETVTAGYEVTSDINILADWALDSYEITFAGINEADYTPPVSTYTILDETISLGQATKTGYKFVGWYTSSDFEESTKVTSIPTGSTGDKTFYAKWEINSYTVSFETNWSEWTIDAEQIEYKSTVTEPTKQREGYTLEGWFTDSDFQNMYDFDTPITAPITLYANWTINTYTITYSTTYGVAPETKTVEWGSKLTEDDLAEIEVEGWVFNGWKLGDTDTYATTETTVTGGIILNADWSIAQITISYETAHGTAPEPITGVYGTSLAEYLILIEADGYDFNGWLLDGKEAEAGTTLKANITLTASWTAKTYSITYNGVEDAENPNDTSEYTIESDAITLADASKDGYTFKGWFPTETFDEGTEETEIPAGSTGDKTFYAKWTPITYNIVYNLDGGENPAAAVETYTIEDEVTLPTPEKSGYTFLGWYDAETDGNKVETISIGSTEDKEYWAKWSQTFTISVDFEAIPKVTADGTWELVKESRTVHNDITDEDEQYDVFVAPEGWTTYTWYVDGVQVEVDSETPNEYRPSGSGGTHSVNCLIIRTVTGDDGEDKQETIYLTGSFTLTVQYQPMG